MKPVVPKPVIDPKHFVPLGAVNHASRSARGVLFGVGSEWLRVDVLGADLLRIKISCAGVFDEEPTAATSFTEPEFVAFELLETEEAFTLSTAALRLVIGRADAALDAYRSDGSPIFESYREAGKSKGYLRLNDAFIVWRKAQKHDAVFGLGEKTGRFNRRGRRFILWNTDVLAPDVFAHNRLADADSTQATSSTAFDPYYASIPFFYHARATRDDCKMAGFFIDNGYKANFEFGEPTSYRYKFSGGQYTEYVFAGPSMKDVLAAYTRITGRMQPPPIWSLGHHQCRWHDYDEASLLELGRSYRERKIPCDVLWLDIEHMDGYRVFSWNTAKFPNRARLFSKLKEAGFRAISIIDPGVKYEPGYGVFDTGRERNLFCKTESGEIYAGQVWPGRTAFPDFSKAEARAWWGELNAKHVATGLAGIWNDMNEPATGEVDPFAMRFDRDGKNHPHERYHNQYALLMAMGTQQGLRQAAPTLRTFILSRAGFAGIQRYAAQWLGDNFSRWDHLALGIPMGTGMSVSGQPFVGADIPGFMEQATPELMARWMQYGALTPFCRCHNNMGEDQQYPWSFGPGVEKICRQALELRYRLLPYIYSAFMRASETGDPIQRPLAYDFQHDPAARDTDDQYLFGEALLVAPVLEPGRTSRHVYLPPGTWIDWHTGEKHAGATLISAHAPIDRIPLFARGGYVVAMHEHAPESTLGHYPELLELHVFVPDEDGETLSILHEDDGLSDAHRSGAYVRTLFSVLRSGKHVKLTARVLGNGYPEHRRQRLRLVLHHVTPGTIRLNGFERAVLGGSLEFDNANEGFEVELELANPPPANVLKPR